MSIYDLAAETADLLDLATAVRDAWSSHDDARVRQAIAVFWRAVAASVSQAPDLDNQLCEALIAHTGGRSEDCPMLRTRKYIHGLRDVLGVKLVRIKPRTRSKLILPYPVEAPEQDRCPANDEVDAAAAALKSADGQKWLELGRQDPSEVRQMVMDRAAMLTASERQSQVVAPKEVSASAMRNNVFLSPEGAEGLSAESRALAVLATYPNLTSLAEVAKKAGCSRSYLSKRGACLIFKSAWEVARKANIQGTTIKRGSKSKDGTVVAWETLKKSG